MIIKEADRLQVLMDRLLTPHRRPQLGTVNIHEVCERVRSLILAEFPDGIRIVRDYDASLPDLRGDSEQLIQAVLNVVRNAAQAMNGRGQAIELRTRVARQVTLAKTRHKLALELQVMDNGPGIPEEIRDRIFYPLVSGRDGGSGLGLTLAQTFVQHHHGVIEVESEPGRTCFTLCCRWSERAQCETGLDRRRRPLDPLGVREGAHARRHSLQDLRAGPRSARRARTGRAAGAGVGHPHARHLGPGAAAGREAAASRRCR